MSFRQCCAFVMQCFFLSSIALLLINNAVHAMTNLESQVENVMMSFFDSAQQKDFKAKIKHQSEPNKAAIVKVLQRVQHELEYDLDEKKVAHIYTIIDAQPMLLNRVQPLQEALRDAVAKRQQRQVKLTEAEKAVLVDAIIKGFSDLDARYLDKQNTQRINRMKSLLATVEGDHLKRFHDYVQQELLTNPEGPSPLELDSVRNKFNDYLPGDDYFELRLAIDLFLRGLKDYRVTELELKQMLPTMHFENMGAIVKEIQSLPDIKVDSKGNKAPSYMSKSQPLKEAIDAALTKFGAILTVIGDGIATADQLSELSRFAYTNLLHYVETLRDQLTKRVHQEQEKAKMQKETKSAEEIIHTLKKVAFGMNNPLSEEREREMRKLLVANPLVLTNEIALIMQKLNKLKFDGDNVAQIAKALSDAHRALGLATQSNRRSENAPLLMLVGQLKVSAEERNKKRIAQEKMIGAEFDDAINRILKLESPIDFKTKLQNKGLRNRTILELQNLSNEDRKKMFDEFEHIVGAMLQGDLSPEWQKRYAALISGFQRAVDLIRAKKEKK